MGFNEEVSLTPSFRVGFRLFRQWVMKQTIALPTMWPMCALPPFGCRGTGDRGKSTHLQHLQTLQARMEQTLQHQMRHGSEGCRKFAPSLVSSPYGILGPGCKN